MSSFEMASSYISVRPNTEYSAEYSAKDGRIFGTEYSAKAADSRYSKKRQKLRFLVIFGTYFHPILQIFLI